MSNEYLDWMREGGACGDCIHNVWLDGEAVCELDVPGHKVQMCDRYEEDEE